MGGVMRIDTELLEPIMVRARLSTREREVMRLECAGPLEDAEIARGMGISVSTVRNLRSRGRQKLAVVQAEAEREAQAEFERHVQEVQEGDEIAELRPYYTFLLAAMQGPRPSNPPTPVFGRTFADASGVTLGEQARLNAGSRACVTPDDLMGRNQVESAWDERVKARRGE
jgi:DNA-binding CsgD family transcriptional regulator